MFIKMHNDFQLKIYAIVGDAAKFRPNCPKHKMDFYPELVLLIVFDGVFFKCYLFGQSFSSLAQLIERLAHRYSEMSLNFIHNVKSTKWTSILSIDYPNRSVASLFSTSRQHRWSTCTIAIKSDLHFGLYSLFVHGSSHSVVM